MQRSVLTIKMRFEKYGLMTMTHSDHNGQTGSKLELELLLLIEIRDEIKIRMNKCLEIFYSLSGHIFKESLNEYHN
ncbi:CLUMA_CG000434, isoform A [Clunio marinus]|uniref:CLUMA_CG000434, isoform A n=1 Tax=Clunio marinus TaxID=568069 RepID=A0A1J1HFT0_9DIPT|nr:CLUMA_CG000434, isoform A [Clunio marinus]